MTAASHSSKTSSSNSENTSTKVPPIFLMGGGSAFPQMQSTFSAVVTRSVLAATGRSATDNGGAAAAVRRDELIPFEFNSGTRGDSTKQLSAQQKGSHNAQVHRSSEGPENAFAGQLVVPQVRFAYPPSASAFSSPGISAGGNTAVSSAFSHSLITAPCIGAAIAAQLPSFDESAISRKDYCR